MKTIYYSIRINKDEEKIKKQIDNILEITSDSEGVWIYELVQKNEDDYIDFIEVFTNILNNKFQLLEEIGIKKDDISIWLLCNFEEQCNLEFSPDQINTLSKIGVGFNISCY